MSVPEIGLPEITPAAAASPSPPFHSTLLPPEKRKAGVSAPEAVGEAPRGPGAERWAQVEKEKQLAQCLPWKEISVITKCHDALQ